MSLLSRKKIYC